MHNSGADPTFSIMVAVTAEKNLKHDTKIPEK